MDYTELKKITDAELREIIKMHGVWLAGDKMDEEGRANLVGYDLSNMMLDNVDLRYAKLDNCSLNNASMFRARLDEASITGADLRYSCLRFADLSNATLQGAVLSYADLHGANLYETVLEQAVLNGVILDCANIAYARLGTDEDSQIARLDFGGWHITVRATETTIGCQCHSNSAWLSWTDESPEIIRMHMMASSWWKMHGDVVKALILTVMRRAKTKYNTKTIII